MTASEFNNVLLVLATATSFTPGPNTTPSTALAVNGGLKRAMRSMRFVCAVPVGWSLLLGGGADLLWLAIKLRGNRSLTRVDEKRLQVGFGQGVALQFLNIKAWMLALSIVAGWMLWNGLGAPA